MSVLRTTENQDATMPRHVAFIMDGNRRWAKKHDLQTSDGHKEGSKTAEQVVEWIVKAGIPHATLWALSTENWRKRSDGELKTIFQLLAASPEQARKLREYSVNVDIVGNREAMPFTMRSIVETVERTLHVPNAKFHVHLALNYGGRDELLQAIRALAAQGISEPTAEDISNNLYTKNIPDVELVIRTGGDQRLSGFMLWQSEYAELAFLNVLWPELTEERFLEVLHNFQHRRLNLGA